MSDRQQEVLNAIDLAVAQCICGNEVPSDGASLDYCSPACQYGYSGPRDAYRLGRGLPDGRTLNDQVAQAFAVGIPSSEHYRDAMHSSPADNPDARRWNSPTDDVYRIVDDIPTTRASRAMWLPPVSEPGVPVAAVDITGSTSTWREWNNAFASLNASIAMSANEFVETVTALGLSATEGARALNEFASALSPEEPVTVQEFRRRALEHQQNRGTGPVERCHRLPRNHQR